MTEIWKPITDFPDYQVSNLGRVKSMKSGKERILNRRVNSRGYDLCQLYNENGMKSRQVHNLVCEHFIGERKNGFFVNHKDGNRLNNCVSNLEYVSNRDNVIHGLKSKTKSSKFTGVSWRKDCKKWQSQICVKGKQTSLGFFNDEAEAHQAYLNALEKFGIECKYAE